MKKAIALTILLLSAQAFAECGDMLTKPFDDWTWNWYKGENGNARMVDKAVEEGCNLNRKAACYSTDVQLTAMSCAALQRHGSVVKKLIAAGADVNARDSEGRTALDYAVMGKDIKTIQLLVNAKADYKKALAEGKKEEPSLYAIQVLLLKERDNFEVCDYDYERVSSYFFLAQAMSKADTSDQKLAAFAQKLKPISTAKGYAAQKNECMLAQKKSNSKTSSESSSGSGVK